MVCEKKSFLQNYIVDNFHFAKQILRIKVSPNSPWKYLLKINDTHQVPYTFFSGANFSFFSPRFTRLCKRFCQTCICHVDKNLWHSSLSACFQHLVIMLYLKKIFLTLIWKIWTHRGLSVTARYKVANWKTQTLFSKLSYFASHFSLLIKICRFWSARCSTYQMG